MSSARFASITSNLLARKGDAAPSLAMLPPRPSAFPDGNPPFPAPEPYFAGPRHLPEERPEPKPVPAPPMAHTAGPEPEHADRPRRIVITLSGEDFERLSIAAIKKDRSRHAVVHAALEAYFHQLAAELPRRCTCMADGGCCS